MHREAEREGLEADAIRGAGVDEAEAVNDPGFAEERDGDRLPLRTGHDRAPEQRRFHRRVAARYLEGGCILERRRTDVREERAANAAKNADGRRHRVNQREAQFGVQVERVLADERQVVIAAHLGVAAEVVEARVFTPAAEALTT